MTVAIPVVTLLHVPPPAASFNNDVAAGQALSEPVILPALGNRFTVTIAVAAAVPQLLITVYEIIEVQVVAPVTRPDVELTVATPLLTLLQVPNPTPSLSNVAVAGHILSEPVITPAFGVGLTVTTTLATAVPQLFATV